MTKKNDKILFLFPYLYLFVSIAISFSILFDESKPMVYQNLWLLPLLFGFFVCFFTLLSSDIWENLSTLSILLLLSIRNVITPFLMFIGEYKGYFNHLVQENVNKGLLLMLIESIILIIYMSLKAKRVSRISDSSVLDLQTNTKERFTFVICLIFIFTTLIKDFPICRTIVNRQECC